MARTCSRLWKCPKRRIDRRFLLVRWQSRCYLVPTEKMQEFCDEVTKGDEPRNEYAGRFYLSDPNARVVGVPELPERWASYLRIRLAIGTIKEVKEDGLVTVDFDLQPGIQNGDLLTVRGNRHFDYRRLRVVSVVDNGCAAQECHPDWYDERLEPGREVIADRLREEKDDP